VEGGVRQRMNEENKEQESSNEENKGFSCSWQIPINDTL
jgi:hypothetical protein